MSKIFRRKRFSNYLGEQRAIDDTIVQFVPDPGPPSPTPTPSVTPTNTPTVTPTPVPVSPTPTPSITPTITPTPNPVCDITYIELATPTPTPTTTTTPTVTPTLTPTPTASPSGFDPDAQSFFTAVIGGGDPLTPTEETAVNQLVIDLKSYGLWGLFDAMYPFVGSTSSSTKWNLINPLDTDAAFRISWEGGMSFNSDGILGNASNSGGNTYLNPQTLGYTGMTMGIYINQGLIATPTNWYDMSGVDSPTNTHDFAIIMGYNDTTTKYVNFNLLSFITTTNGSYIESLFLGQNDGTTTRLYQNTTELVNGAEPFSPVNSNMGIGCSWRGSVSEPSGRGYSISFIGGTALDITQIGNLNTSINTFNTTLGR